MILLTFTKSDWLVVCDLFEKEDRLFRVIHWHLEEREPFEEVTIPLSLFDALALIRFIDKENPCFYQNP
jgi:hypothetical protein